MSAARPQDLTVEEIRKLALPLSTHVLSGEGLLDRPTTWTTVIHPEDDLDSKSVQRGELILIAALTNPPKAHSDTELIHWTEKVGASAVVFCGLVSTSALAEAKSRNLPVLSLPDDTRIRDVEKTIVGLLVNRKGNIERRGTQIYRQLTQISSRNEGMDELIGAIARLTKKTVILQDKRLRPYRTNCSPALSAYGTMSSSSSRNRTTYRWSCTIATRDRSRSACTHAGLARFRCRTAGRACHYQEYRARLSFDYRPRERFG